MLTKQQYERLPEVCKKIVDIDRQISREKAKPVISLYNLNVLSGERGRLVRAAADIYGGNGNKDSRKRK